MTPVTFGTTFASYALVLSFLPVVSNILCGMHAANLQGKMLCIRDDKNKQVCKMCVPYVYCDINVLSKEKKVRSSSAYTVLCFNQVHLLCSDKPSFWAYTFWCTKWSQFLVGLFAV